MTLLASLEAVALVAVVWFMLRHFAEQEARWAVERRELLNRIQRPELVPVASGRPFVEPEREPDEIAMVGTITYPDEMGTD